MVTVAGHWPEGTNQPILPLDVTAKSSPPSKQPSAPRRITRRRALTAAGGLLGLGVAARFGWPRIARPAPPSGPLSASARSLLATAWKGLEPKRVIDCHVHVIGLGTGDSGCWVNPHMRDWRHPMQYARFDIYRRAAGIEDLSRADQQYAESLVALATQFEPHGRLLALAFDHAHREDGKADLEASEFFVPNDHVLGLARQHAKALVACASIHPYRADAVAELERVAAAGARCIKWLPSAMRIDPASPRCDAFYRKLVELKVPLLTHAGEERAVEVEEAQKLCNPLRLRRPLDLGVDVIVCHCASSGQGDDLDAPGKRADNFDLFLRLMDDAGHREHLWGEISAMTQFNRCEKPLRTKLGLHRCRAACASRRAGPTQPAGLRLRAQAHFARSGRGTLRRFGLHAARPTVRLSGRLNAKLVAPARAAA
jgi:mannonate dehydratase